MSKMKIAAFAKSKNEEFDPDHYRMSIGDHLEELRRRIILAMVGFVIVTALCLLFVRSYVMPTFCRPLLEVFRDHDISPQLFYTQMADPFMVYIEMSLISAAAIASPWIIYQLWLFVAAGLYPAERKIVTKYIPLSITLLISGMLFVYFLVLPWTLEFFLAFSISIPLPSMSSTTTTQPAATQQNPIVILQGDPAQPFEGELWLNHLEGRLKMFYDGRTRVVQFGPENLTSPIITLPDYIDLVFGMLLTFGLSFQLPLVVMALVAIGIVERSMLKEMRRYIYFAISILAAAITPGDVVTATIALMFPLIGLYELGIWLSRPPGTATDDGSPVQ